MKNVVIIGIVLTGLVLFGLSDSNISIADTGIPNNEAANSISKANNSSESGTITITMTGILDG